MENTQQQILSEIKTLMASVRSQLEELDAKIALWQQMADPQEADTPIELDFDLDFDGRSAQVDWAQAAVDTVAADVAAEMSADLVSDDMPVSDEEPVDEELVSENPSVFQEESVEVVAEDIPVEDPVMGLVVEVVEEIAEENVEVPIAAEPVVAVEPVVQPVEPEVQDDIDDLPFFDVPEEVAAPQTPAQTPQTDSKPAVIDVMTEKHAWRTAMPGSPVKDVRGAIALMDRVLFINSLFGTDAMAFQDALNQINQMQTLDEAVEYLASTHPEWDFNSQTVYSFMMAVRRKVN